jgi:hypothetical protein
MMRLFVEEGTGTGEEANNNNPYMRICSLARAMVEGVRALLEEGLQNLGDIQHLNLAIQILNRMRAIPEWALNAHQIWMPHNFIAW